jgi:hypothetical protein
VLAMTEYELADSIASMIAVLLTWIGLSFTFLTAYLVTAYAVGRSLTGSQAWIINTFFCIYQLMTINGFYTSGSRYLEFVEEIRKINPDRTYSFSETALFSGPVAFTLVTVFALKFMWDIRHPKSN